MNRLVLLLTLLIISGVAVGAPTEIKPDRLDLDGQPWAYNLTGGPTLEFYLKELNATTINVENVSATGTITLPTINIETLSFGTANGETVNATAAVITNSATAEIVDISGSTMPQLRIGRDTDGYTGILLERRYIGKYDWLIENHAHLEIYGDDGAGGLPTTLRMRINDDGHIEAFDGLMAWDYLNTDGDISCVDINPTGNVSAVGYVSATDSFILGGNSITKAGSGAIISATERTLLEDALSDGAAVSALSITHATAGTANAENITATVMITAPSITIAGKVFNFVNPASGEAPIYDSDLGYWKNETPAGGGGGGGSSPWTEDGANIHRDSGLVSVATDVFPSKFTVGGDFALQATSTIPIASSKFLKIWHREEEIPAQDGLTLLLHMDGSDASTIFPDDSIESQVVTANDDAQVDTAQYKFGTGALLTDTAGGDCLTIPYDADLWDFSNEDFTIDFWVRSPSLGTTAYEAWFCAVDTSAGWGKGICIWKNYSGTNQFRFNLTFTDDTVWTASVGALTVNTWHHVALVRYGSDFDFYVNGASAASTSSVKSVTPMTSGVFIGNTKDLDDPWRNGWIDELRVVKGKALWTGNFDVPTQASGNINTSVLSFLTPEGATAELMISQQSESATPAITVRSGNFLIGDPLIERSFGIGIDKGSAIAVDWDTWSERGLKKDIESLPPDELRTLVAELKQIRLSRFRFKQDSPEHALRFGMIADEAPPQIRTDNGDGISLGRGLSFSLATQRALLERIELLEKALADQGINIPTVTPTPTLTPIPKPTATATATPKEATGTIEREG